MFNLSGSELVFLVLIALVVLGPDKLPEAMRKAGKAYADFKKMTSGFQSEMRSVLDEPMRELRETAELAKKAASWDTNMLDTRAADTRAADTRAADTKPVSASMAAQTPVAPAVAEASTAGSDAVPAVDNPTAADATADATTRRLHAQAEPAAETKPFSPNFSSAAPQVTPPAADTDEAAAE